MLKQEIIEKITKYFKLTTFEAEKIYEDIFQIIVAGIKEDNITDVPSLGEFIVKINDINSGNVKKTVEFLPSGKLEDEIGEASEVNTYEIEPERTTVTEPVVEKVPEMVPVNTSFKGPEKEKVEYKQPEIISKVVTEPEIKEGLHTESHLSVEEEIKKKREEIIHKLDPQHEEEYHHLLHVEEGIPLNVPKPVLIPEPVNYEKGNLLKENHELDNEFKAPQKEELLNQKEEAEDLTSKSFSDFFTEVKGDKSNKESGFIPPVIPPVIPPAAVELHEEITGEKTVEPQEMQELHEVPPPPVNMQNGNGYVEDAEKQAKDSSYYIWYKDSEPNAIDTQTMSYEYELLYQATKEAEYKSKLRIYVTTFILFFSVVLMLLIFSPVLYKYFFTPKEDQVNKELVPSEEGNTTQENKDASTPPVQNEQQNTNQTNTTKEQPVQKNEQQNTQTEQNTQGLVKSAGGWIDDKNKVVYVQLENGKFAIQESSWDSEAKANNRVGVVSSYNIAGLTGSVVKSDLGTKGIWYRTRFGEFSTIDEAKTKAEELRKR